MASTLPYDVEAKKLRLAMRNGGKYRLDAITQRHWNKLAAIVRLDEEQLRMRCLDLTDRLPDAVTAVIKTAQTDGLDITVLQRLSTALIARASHCRKILMASPSIES